MKKKTEETPDFGGSKMFIPKGWRQVTKNEMLDTLRAKIADVEVHLLNITSQYLTKEEVNEINQKLIDARHCVTEKKDK